MARGIAAGLIGIAALTALAVGLWLWSDANGRSALPRITASKRSHGVPRIGALYRSSSATKHTCTASVVASPSRNTLVTAAHCVSGNGAGMVFVPDQRASGAPYGRWQVVAAHLAPEWVTRRDPDADVAFLTVAPRRVGGARVEIGQVTGGYALGPTARPGQRVTVTGYPGGVANDPITCTTTVYLTDGIPSFDCGGFVGGTSGSPWLLSTRHGTEVVGVIGGRNEGGCLNSTSYSSHLSPKARRTYRRAVRGAPADTAPPRGSDGC